MNEVKWEMQVHVLLTYLITFTAADDNRHELIRVGPYGLENSSAAKE